MRVPDLLRALFSGPLVQVLRLSVSSLVPVNSLGMDCALSPGILRIKRTSTGLSFSRGLCHQSAGSPGTCPCRQLAYCRWFHCGGADRQSNAPTGSRVSNLAGGKRDRAGMSLWTQQALDQTGATLGPLITAWVLYVRGRYKRAFAALLISAMLCLCSLILALLLHPTEQVQKAPTRFLETSRFSKAYWTYFAAGMLIAAGFADFSLIAFHFQKAATVTQNLIPIFYSAAMASGAGAALVFGRLFDKCGRPIVLLAFFLSSLFAPFVFFGSFGFALAGMVLWGIGMGVQDSLLKALLADTIPTERRSTAFALFDTGFGISWFIGSAAMGLVYGLSIPGLVILSVVLQLAALPLFLSVKSRLRQT
jgi:hypothetical protein